MSRCFITTLAVLTLSLVMAAHAQSVDQQLQADWLSLNTALLHVQHDLNDKIKSDAAEKASLEKQITELKKTKPAEKQQDKTLPAQSKVP